MRFHVHHQIEISRRPAADTAIALARNTQPRAVLGAGNDAHFDDLRRESSPLTATSRTNIAHFAGAAAGLAGQLEAHHAGHLGHLPGALALGTTSPRRAATGALAFAFRAFRIMLDADPRDRAANGVPKPH